MSPTHHSIMADIAATGTSVLRNPREVKAAEKLVATGLFEVVKQTCGGVEFTVIRLRAPRWTAQPQQQG